MRCAALILFYCVCVAGAADYWVAPSNRINWVKGWTAGSQVSRPALASQGDSGDMVKAGADPTGVIDCTALFNSMAEYVGYLWFSNGLYKINGAVTLGAHNSQVIGQSTNAVLWLNGGSIKFGFDAVSINVADIFYAEDCVKGSTNLSLFWVTNATGVAIVPNQSYYLSSLMQGDSTWALINSTDYAGSQHDVFREHIVVHSITGTNVAIKRPLDNSWTNGVRLRSTSYLGAIAGFEMRTNNVLANITITNSAASLGSMVSFAMCRNFFITNVNIWRARNYNLSLNDCVSGEITGSDIGITLDSGLPSNHGGVLWNACSGVLLENTIIRPQFPQLEWNAGSGNVVFGCYFVSNSANLGPDNHGPHPIMHLFEHNIIPEGAWKTDGYFGSASHHTLWRNFLWFIDLKRWSTRIQIGGNIIGRPWDTSYTSAQLINSGLPNIGSGGFFGTSPPFSWNYPGPAIYTGETNNGILITNNQISVTTVTGDFSAYISGIATLAGNVTMVSQDNVNTQKLHWTVPYVATVATSSNLVFNGPVTVSNGWRIYMGGSGAFQTKQLGDISNSVVHGNLLYTNAGGTLVWDASIADHTISNSLLYPSKPPWWGDVPWPGVDPATGLATNPAQARFFATGAISPPTPARFFLGGNVQAGGNVSAQ